MRSDKVLLEMWHGPSKPSASLSTLWCPQSLDVRLTIIAMKTLGVLSGVVGVWLLVYSDKLKTDGPVPHPYYLWLLAGVLVVIGFVMFYRK